MKALIYDGRLYLNSHRPLPKGEPGEALIRVRIAGICQTDLEILKGYMGFKGVLGHEFVGEVVKDSCDELLGARVVGEINCPCYKCSDCLTGRTNHCPNRSVLGILARDGAFAQYLSLPISNLHLVPDEITDEEAVFIEPTAACFQILEQLHFQPDQDIAILGDGKLGLIASQVMRLTGCHVTLIGKHPEKLSLAFSWGIESVLRGQLNKEKKYDFVIDCTGKAEGFREALQLTRAGGTIVVKSTVYQAEQIDLAPLVINEIRVVGSRCGPFAPALRALKGKLVTVKSMISSIFPLDNGLEAIEAASRPETLKVLIKVV